MTIKTKNAEGILKNHFFGLYLRNLASNLFAFGTIVILNVATPLEFMKLQRKIIFSEGGWLTFFLFLPFVLLLVGLLQYRVQRPIVDAASFIKKQEDMPPELMLRAGKRLLNLPFTVAFINLAAYLSLTVLVVLSFYFSKGIPLTLGLFLYFRAIMIGMIAASISFFLLEDYTRKRFVPLFFPDGKLVEMSGVIRISILRRIRILNGAGTINPMILLLFTLLYLWLEAGGIPVSAEQLSGEILFFSIILCTIFVIIALRLNFLVGDSILNPVKDMLRVVEKVKEGYFDQKIRVVSNDEIGILGDAGNAMIQGLADRERIRETFGKYVTPEIRDQILAGKIPLNGELREATLLFSDLRDFTPYVEENSPEEVIRSMRDYFTAMQKAIRRHQGLVIQYVGDEIEAVFGVPISFQGHEDMALQAALDMRSSLEQLNSLRLRAGRPAFRHGIGIYTGMVLAGNTGSEDRLSYALIGNTVNLASRIQGLTKGIGCDILVSEETRVRLRDAYPLEKAPPQTVKGYSRPITVYRVI